jgi:hypothetical protein
MGSTPEVDLDLAATLPMQKNVLAGMSAARGGAPQPARGTTETMVMSPDQPVASPAPVWKQEMQQWRAHRESSSSLEAVAPEDLVHNGTQALDHEAVMRATAGAVRTTSTEPAATTSTIGALSQPTGAYPVPPGLAQSPGNAQQRRKRSSGFLFAMMGVGVLAAVGVVAVLLLSTSQGEGEGGVAGPTTPQAVSTAAPAVAPPAATEAMPAAPEAPAPPPSSAPSSEPAQAPSAAPNATGGPGVAAPGTTGGSGAVAPGTTAAPVVPPKAPTSKTPQTSPTNLPGVVPLCKEGGKLVPCKPKKKGFLR